jgi:hypothetical protein
MNDIINYERALAAGRSFIAQIHEDLQKGDDRSLKSYLCTLGDHHEHGWMNVALIHLQRPRALKICTREEWLRLGRQIRNNAEPIILLAPSGATGRPAPDDLVDAYGRVPVNKFGMVIAFNISDTSGHPYPWSIVHPGQINFSIGGLRDFITHELGRTLALAEEQSDHSTYSGQLDLAFALSSIASMTVINERLPTADFPLAVRQAEATLAAFSIVSAAAGRPLQRDVPPIDWPTASCVGRSLSRIQQTANTILSYIMLDSVDN